MDKLVEGRYRLLDRIGHGAMSVVWQARDERLNRLVALKELRQDAGLDDGAFFRSCARAVREARLAAQLRHLHAVTVYDVIESAGSVYVVMEFLPSRSLTDLVLEHGPLGPDEAARLGRQIASALAAAHAAGILHRDVTPNNVLVTEDGTAKIVDFGVSHAVGDATATGNGLVVGTVAYLAPEVASGDEGGFPADVYSLGATLYTALEGAPPFGTDDNPVALLERIVHDKLTPPRHAGALAGALTRMLHRDPAARPTMAEVEELLTTSSRPKRRRVAVVAGAAAVCVIAAGVAFGSGSSPVAAPVTPATTTVTSEATVHTTATASVTPSSTVTATPTIVAERVGCLARYEVTSSWSGGDQVLVQVRNTGAAALTGWTVSWPAPAGVDVQHLWDGVLDRRDPVVSVRNAAWNGQVGPNATITFGFNETTTGPRSALPVLTCRTA